MKTFACVLAVLAAAAGTIAKAEQPQYPTKPYDANFSEKSPFGDSTIRMCSDGKGHTRTEMNSPTGKTITVYDYPAKQMTTAIESQKMIMHMDMPPQTKKAITDEESAKAAGAKSLGAKTVDGHPCHGWEASNDKVTTRSWVGDDIHFLVHSETEMQKGKQVISLKSYSDKSPADLLSMPSGYKEVKMPKTAEH